MQPTTLTKRIRGRSCVRDLFALVVEQGTESTNADWRDDLSDPALVEDLLGFDSAGWSAMTNAQRATWLIGQLWICTATMPRPVCEALDLPQGSSYAQGARKLREEMP